MFDTVRNKDSGKQVTRQRQDVWMAVSKGFETLISRMKGCDIMSGNFSAISGYNKTNQSVNAASKAYKESASQSAVSKNASKNYSDAEFNSDVKVKEYKPLPATSSLIPTEKKGYGTVVGDVNLSEKGLEYYNKLKEKFHGMDFILVNSDMKDKVAKNYYAYGNANRQVVLIDVDKIERMATDEAYRKKYEGIIAGSTEKMAAAKNSLVSAGAVVKNFGMSVAEDGSTSFFATIQKDFKAGNDALKARQAKKKEAAKVEKKKAEAKEKEKVKEKKAKEAKGNEKIEEDKEEDIFKNTHEYLNFESDSIEALVDKVSKYVYSQSENAAFTAADSGIGQSIDFRG